MDCIEPTYMLGRVEREPITVVFSNKIIPQGLT